VDQLLALQHVLGGREEVERLLTDLDRLQAELEAREREKPDGPPL
jgi:hypothetical protein